MAWAHDPAYRQQSHTTSLSPMGQAEEKGFCHKDGSVEKPLCPQDGGASPHLEVPGATDGWTCGGVLGKRYALHPAWVLVLAVLVALVLALAAAVAVLSGRRGGDAARAGAPVLACPEDWVGYRNVCYYLSREQGSWEWSQERCSSQGAGLAVLSREWEVEFLGRLKGNVDYWLGLRRRGERLEWVDGSSFNQTIKVKGQEPCLFLNDNDLMSARCSQPRPYLCSKPPALMGTP